MKVMIGACIDCPFKKIDGEVHCRLTDATLLSQDIDEIDYVTAGMVHPDCPMFKEKVTVELEQASKKKNGGHYDAFFGWRVRLNNGKMGVICAKYENGADTRLDLTQSPCSEEEKKLPFYRMLVDGGGYLTFPASTIAEILDTKPSYNFNPSYEFYFGKAK